jgi:hypothetical protein
MKGRTARSSVVEVQSILSDANLIEEKIAELAMLREAEESFLEDRECDDTIAPMSVVQSSGNDFGNIGGSGDIGGGGGGGGVDDDDRTSPSSNMEDVTTVSFSSATKSESKSTSSSSLLSFNTNTSSKATTNTATTSAAASSAATTTSTTTPRSTPPTTTLPYELPTKLMKRPSQHGEYVGKVYHGHVSKSMSLLEEFELKVDMESSMEVVNALASLNDVLPVVSAISPLMCDILESASSAKYNQLAAKLLADRVVEVAAVLHELLEDVTESTSALDTQLQRLEPLLFKCSQFMYKYSRRGHLAKVKKCGPRSVSLSSFSLLFFSLSLEINALWNTSCFFFMLTTTFINI